MGNELSDVEAALGWPQGPQQEILLVKAPTVPQARNPEHGISGLAGCWEPDDRPK